MPMKIKSYYSSSIGLILLGMMMCTNVYAQKKELRHGKCPYPLVEKMKTTQPLPVTTNFSSGLLPIAKNENIFLKSASAPEELLGNVIHQTYWDDDYSPYGIYTVPTSGTIKTNYKYLNWQLEANGSGAIYDDVFHFVHHETSWNGTFTAKYMEYTPDSRSITKTVNLTEDQYNLIAREVAYDPNTGLTYGQFFNNSLEGYEIAAVNYATLERTTLGSTDLLFVAIAMNKAGQLYGVASDGNLYKIDKTNGSTTLIGATGLSIADANGDAYMQSGDIDRTSGIFYWAAVTSDGKSALYTVDLETGAATKIGDFQNNDYIVALTAPIPAAEDDAPAICQNLNISFEAESLNGTVSFTAPIETFNGEQLQGNVNYYIIANSDTIKSGTATPGLEITENIEMEESGEYVFTVVTKNEVGYSPAAKSEKIWIGPDEPKAPTNVTVVMEGQTATVTWAAPQSGMHGMEMPNLKYDVMRLSDSIYVAQDITETTITDEIPLGDLSIYKYEVIAKNGTHSKSAISNAVVVGNPIEPPYKETFDTEDALSFYTIIDANNDWRTWRYWYYQDLQIQVGWSSPADDWLITPPMHLKAEHLYVFSFQMRSMLGNHDKYEVAYGIGDDPANYEVVYEGEEGSGDYHEVKVTVKNPVDRVAKFGIHLISEANQGPVRVDDIAVSAGAPMNAPDSISNLQVIPGEKGALNATIKFNAPEFKLDGERLASLSKIDIIRDDSILVKSLTNVAPGSEQSIEDFLDEGDDGFHTYKVVAWNGNNQSLEVTATAYIGSDFPKVPKSAWIEDNTSNIKIAWEKVVDYGSYHYYVDADKVTYNVYTVDEEGYQDQKLASEIHGTEFFLEQNPDEGNQELVCYAVTAKNAATKKYSYTGETPPTITKPMVIGEPMNLPYHESFAEGKPSSFVWVERSYDTTSDWGTTNTMYADTDRGAAMWAATKADECASFNLGKISLAATNNPKIVFSYFANSENITLDIVGMKPDQTLDTLTTLELEQMDGWKRTMVDLAKMKDCRYTIIKFVASSTGEGVIGLDNINIFDMFINDLAVSIVAPKSVAAQKEGEVQVKISNVGEEFMAGYDVTLYANEEPIETITISKALEALSDTTIVMNLHTKINSPETINVYAEVTTANDQNEENNKSNEEAVKVIFPKAPTVTTLEGKRDGDAIELTWAAPEIPPYAEITDNFESYEHGMADEFGDWTIIDDGFNTYYMNGLTFDLNGKPYAFMVWNPVTAGIPMESNPSYAPFSGEQYLMHMDANSSAKDGDNDYLISPELPGIPQTISFYAKSQSDRYLEAIEIMYSTSGNAPEDFIVLQEIPEVPTEWTNYSIELPEGTTYFAVHVVSKHMSQLFIDDATFTAKGANAGTITGYNIYRDGELIGNVDASETSFTDEEAGAYAHDYNITVVYSSGIESVFSNTASIDVNAIREIIVSDNNPSDIYSLDGAVVAKNATSLKGLKTGVYMIRNRKIVIK